MILSKEYIVDPRVNKEAKSLSDAGHNVTVLMWDRQGNYPSESIVDSVQVHRIHNTKLMNILPNDLWRNPLWWKAAYKKAVELYKKRFTFDVVHCHDLDTLQPGVRLKKKLGCKLVYDAHEIFGSLIKNNVPNVAVTYSYKMEKKLVKHVDHLITVNEPLEQYFQSITNTPITIVMNCNDSIIKEYRPSKNNVFTICYFGLLSKDNMFPQIVDIIGNIENVKFVIAAKKENSSLYEKVQKQCKKYNNIKFLGTIPSSEILSKTLECDVVLAVVDPSIELNRIGISNKLLEAMAVGRPMITTSSTYRGELVEREKAGLAIAFNEEAVKKTIIHLRDNPQLCETLGKNGFQAAKKTYNWEAQKIKLLKIYEGFT